MRLHRRALFILLVAVASLTLDAAGPPENVTRVLFVGNSYTYFNDLPEIFSKLAESGHHKVKTGMDAPGGSRLKDHWNEGPARQLLKSEKWDFVVLQDQSTLGVNYWVEGKNHVNGDSVFRPYAEKWVAAIREAKVTPVFYLTWAGIQAPEDQPALTYAYNRAARDTASVLAPVGLAWDAVRRDHPQIGLFYEGHGSHPSPAGSYLAACVFYAAIFHESPVGLTSRITGVPVNLDTEKPEPDKNVNLVDLNPRDSDILQKQAWNTWQQIAGQGGYAKAAPPQAISVPPLPAGVPLSARDLDGSWQGKMLFYPIGPVDIVLDVQSKPALAARLEIKYHSKNFPDESIKLTDFRVEGATFLFSDPTSVGVDKMRISFTGVSPARGEIQGTAEAQRDDGDRPVTVIGTWSLKKQTK